MKSKIACPWEEKSCDKPRHNIKMKKHGFAKEGPYSQSYVFFSVVMYGCESWAIKKAECWRIDAFAVSEKTLESPLGSKEIKPVNLKGNLSWIFIGRIYPEAESPIIWPPDGKKNWFIRKDPDSRKDWRQEEKRITEDEMVDWHHWLDGHEFGQLVMDRRPGVLQSTGLQRVRHDWTTELANSAYKLNKQGDNIQPWHTSFPIWNQSVVPCQF